MTTPRKPSMNGYPDPSVTLRPAPVDDLSGRQIAVIGGTDGLGRALARWMVARGATVTVVGRTMRDEVSPRLRFVKADLSLMTEAARVGELLPADLNLVVLTTGILAARAREVTAEGLERDMAVSFLSRVAALGALVPRLQGGKRPRVFVMGFPGAGNLGDPDDLNAERSYAQMPVHMNTVAGNEALVIELAKRHPQLGVFGLNPGLIKTNIRANVFGEGSLLQSVAETVIGWFTPSADDYAATIAPVLFAPELEGRTGLMFGKGGTAIQRTDGMTDERAAAFVTAGEALIVSRGRSG
jgi:NAD(P)-dependent dehydrogenase (short-subunit alcohol dehydrogenase family)